MKQNNHIAKSQGLLCRATLSIICLFLFFDHSLAQELSVNDLEGDWEVGSTWTTGWNSGGGPVSGVTSAATINGDVFVLGSLDYAHNNFSTGLTIQGSDTLTVFGDLTFTGALMILDVTSNAVLKVYGDLNTGNSIVDIRGDGVIVVSGDLVLNGASSYHDAGGANQLYVDGLISGTSADLVQTQTDAQDFSDLSGDHPVLYSEITSELPVVLLDFKATAHGSGVKLDWSTASEENFDHFEIQRSVDGTTYTNIGKMAGHGNSSQVINYSFLDESPWSGISYYRLSAKDYDGSSESFKSISVEWIDLENTFSIYPNPMRQASSQLTVGMPKGLSQGQITVLDPAGRIIVQEKITAQLLSWQMKTSLNKGIYHIRVQTAGQILTRKFLVN